MVDKPAGDFETLAALVLLKGESGAGTYVLGGSRSHAEGEAYMGEKKGLMLEKRDSVPYNLAESLCTHVSLLGSLRVLLVLFSS